MEEHSTRIYSAIAKKICEIKFLGVGGGDLTMLLQILPTSCIYVETDLKFLIDPGPGTLVNARRWGVNIFGFEWHFGFAHSYRSLWRCECDTFGNS